MCIEKTPWELVIDFHGHTCPTIALGFRIAQLAQREMGVKPTADSQCLVKAYTQSCAVDAMQVLNKATTGRGTLFIQEDNTHIYEFHFTGTEEIHQFTVTSEVVSYLESLLTEELSPRAKQNKILEGVQYILSLEEAKFCQYKSISGILPLPTKN